MDKTAKIIGMFVLIKLILYGSIYSCVAQAGEFWTDDKVANTLMVSANALIVMDWAQTRESSHNGYEEVGLAKNFIGSNPGNGDVNRYFVTSLVTYNAINYLLPTNLKKWFSGYHVALELSVVKDNYQLGVGMRF